MKDRFVGFRYEMTSVSIEAMERIKLSIRDKADELYCFGWVQASPRQTVVGEARCRRDEAFKLKSHLSLLASDSSSVAPTMEKDLTNRTITTRDYPDTLIRLHFSQFKLLDNERNTCFRDEPHKCSHLYDETEDGVKFRDR